MKGRKRRGSTTISHPIYGHVQWLNTNDAGTEILIERYCAKHGEHIREWINWTFPTKKES